MLQSVPVKLAPIPSQLIPHPTQIKLFCCSRQLLFLNRTCKQTADKISSQNDIDK
jgi:hypothetical protein